MIFDFFCRVFNVNGLQKEASVAVFAQVADKNKDFVFIRLSVSLFTASLIKCAVGGFIYRQAPEAGRCR